MKTSTKNVIIGGMFTVIASFTGGFVVGHNLQNSEIKDAVKQSGLINISYNDSSDDIIVKLIELISQMNYAENQIIGEETSVNQTQLTDPFGNSLLQNGTSILTGWWQIDAKWYYFDSINGKRKTGWQQIDNKWYYFDLIKGSMKTGWQQIDAKWYYFDLINGNMKTGWQQIGNKWYYFDLINGNMKTGWQQIGNEWYYLDLITGSMKTGWQQIRGKWYYMKENGECLFNTVTPDGYIVNEKGEWVESERAIFEK